MIKLTSVDFNSEYMDALQEEEKARNALEKVTFDIKELSAKVLLTRTRRGMTSSNALFL